MLQPDMVLAPGIEAIRGMQSGSVGLVQRNVQFQRCNHILDYLCAYLVNVIYL
jgi:hypothetical protein